ncbi:hypothetical protein EMIHUDRAFT_200654 [Emiliania huxleyi CCMP1516]|uniref:VDE lipocalin domain-containing protein n=3 Tax=Emiliania huxleyi TaxID=2903 RepID=A0A0D3KQW9_EMIH1|nr:hypothetical protein EMIHUDRAFT_200654 [Emiliania huxleyi CCMP1516]EOD38154.1 hypothetical protein EMIHUDRAFT_200654 [Emiliania huxleyi CCMP1516]|eukprot:XP_005790583.1 hypothetical protein EMIHUDRAFT_200654 [Emiliania huxleyi CCMP1516]
MPSPVPPLSLLLLASQLPRAASQSACVVEHCGAQLARCLADTACRGWSLCNAGCGLGTEALACNQRCADLHTPLRGSPAIDAFSICTISDHHCVPQRRQRCAVPRNTLPALELAAFEGDWWVTRGLNPIFDCFDCQRHTFSLGAAGEPKRLHGALRYSVKRDLHCSFPQRCEYVRREVNQSFAQSNATGHLANHGNPPAQLHYADDWYVIAHRPETYILVYYCGCNDADCGYSGAVLYTRSRSGALDAADKAAVAAAARAAGVDGFELSALCTPDNRACPGCGSTGPIFYVLK